MLRFLRLSLQCSLFTVSLSSYYCFCGEDFTDRVFTIPDVYLERVEGDQYSLTIGHLEKIMTYARFNQPQKSCMAIYADTYGLPEQAALVAFMQSAEKMEPFISSFGNNKFSSVSEGSNSSNIEGYARLKTATPLCSTCKTVADYVDLGVIHYRCSRSGCQNTFFAFRELVNDLSAYATAFNSKF